MIFIKHKQNNLWIKVSGNAYGRGSRTITEPIVVWYAFLKREKMFNLTSSVLYDQTTFYKAFLRDSKKAKTRVIIESLLSQKSE